MTEVPSPITGGLAVPTVRAIGLNVNGTNGINEYYRLIGRDEGGVLGAGEL